MTTVTAPPHNLNTGDLARWWQDNDPKQRDVDVSKLALRIRQARNNGHLARVAGGHDAYHTPDEIMRWFSNGCRYTRGNKE